MRNQMNKAINKIRQSIGSSQETDTNASYGSEAPSSSYRTLAEEVEAARRVPEEELSEINDRIGPRVTENESSNPPNMSSFQRSVDFDSSQYEEFSRGTVPCPSCMGTGKIPKEREGELMALIPIKDKRLKPRKTGLYVGLAVLICAIIAGLISFLCVPRTVLLQNKVQVFYPDTATKCGNPNDTCYSLSYSTGINITNNNYFPISVKGIEMVATLNLKQVSNTLNKTLLSIPARSSQYAPVKSDLIMSGNLGDIYKVFCVGVPHDINTPLSVKFLFTVTSSLLEMHTESDPITFHQTLGCANQTILRRT